MNQEVVVRIANTVVALSVIVSGILGFVFFSFRSFILGVYSILFGVILLANDFKLAPELVTHFPFLSHILGLGLTYLFLGFFILGSSGASLILGIIVIVIAVLAIIFHFLVKRQGGVTPQMPTSSA